MAGSDAVLGVASRSFLIAQSASRMHLVCKRHIICDTGYGCVVEMNLY
jgi:hypothetical protein